MKTNTTSLTVYYCIIAVVIMFFCTSSFAQDEDSTKKKINFKAFAEKAASAMSNKPHYWMMSMTTPVELKTEKIEFPYKDQDISLVFWFNHGAGKMGIQGPDHICIDLVNLSDDAINVKWDELKITNLKGDGVRSKIRKMHGAGVYAPETQTVAEGEKVQFCFSTAHCIRTYHHNAHYDDQGNWIDAWDQLEDFRIFCGGDCDPDVVAAGTNIEKMKTTVVGKEFTIYLPVEIRGELQTKSFSFRIEDVREWKK